MSGQLLHSSENQKGLDEPAPKLGDGAQRAVKEAFASSIIQQHK